MKNRKIASYVLCVCVLISACKKQLNNYPEVGNNVADANMVEAAASQTTYQLLEIGGSNYPMYDVQNYLDNPTNETWNTNGALNLVVGHYHLNATNVNNQLADMYSKGQRKIAIPIWYGSLTNIKGDTYGHLIRNDDGKMTTQHLANYKAVLRKIVEIGYKEVIIRFGPQSNNRPTEWESTWNEPMFQENWNFQSKAIKVCDSILDAKAVKHMYDLCIELGGITKGQAAAYAKKMWQNYVTVFGNKQSYGFSIANAPGRLTNLINNLSTTNHLPAEYAVDIYKETNKALDNIASELAAANQLHKPLLIQECHYNNSKTFDTVMANVLRNNIRLRFIMQWPVEVNSNIKHFSVNYCQQYSNYARPYIIDAGSGCTDKYCVWIIGQNFEADKAIVKLYNPANNILLNTYKQTDLNQELRDGKWVIEFKLKTEQEKTLFASGGLKFSVINPGYNNVASSLALVTR
jgi:hypothetical protein